MSFSADVKNEVSRNDIKKRCCMLAEISGFVRAAGSIRISGRKKIDIVMATENPAIARRIKKITTTYFNVVPNLLVGEAGFNKNKHVYELIISAEKGAEQILKDTGMLEMRDGFYVISESVNTDILKSKCCRKSYIRGLFLGAGTLSDPDKGHHLEISTSSDTLAHSIRRLFNSFDGIHAKIADRHGKYGVYLKNSDQIMDILGIIGAHSEMLKYENVKVMKEVRNRINRINNCEYANMDKTIAASEKQMDDIRKIALTVGLDALPGKLLDLALVRQNHPEATLCELGELLDPPLKKSGVLHRIRKISEFAENCNRITADI